MLGVGYLLSMNQRDESTIVEVDGKSLRLTLVEGDVSLRPRNLGELLAELIGLLSPPT